jgi:MFS family permease
MNALTIKKGLAVVYPWIIWTLAASFFFYKYLVQVSPSVMTDDLMSAFNIHATGLGNLSAFYFYAYLTMQIPVGILLDKYSPRLLTTVAIFVCSLSTFLFAHSTSLWEACLCRALMGAGAAFAAVSCFKLAALWFNPKRFALVSGMFMTAAMLGAVGGQMPLSLLVQHVGWRTALEIVGGIGLVLGLIYYLILRDKSTQVVHKPLKKEPIGYCFKRIITNKQAWLLSLYSGLAFAPVSVFGGLWGVPFLETAYHLTRTDAAMAISCIFIGFAAGAPFWGWFSDYIQRRKPVLFTGTFAALICLLIVLYSPNQILLTLMIFLFFFGFGASGFFTSFAMIRELFPIVLVATVLGIMNTFNAVFEALFEPLVGAILDWTWDGAVVNGMHRFSLQDYHESLLLLPGALLIALLCLIFIKETHCRVIAN